MDDPLWQHVTKYKSDTYNNAVYEEVDAGVDEEEEVWDGLGVEEVGGREVVLVVAQAFHWVVHRHHSNHCLRADGDGDSD